MDIDKPTHMEVQQCFGLDGTQPMDADDNAQSMDAGLGSLFSAKPPKTKPVPRNKFQNRLGATKKAKRLEIDERSEFALSPEDATMYWALSARCYYLAQDRSDI